MIHRWHPLTFCVALLIGAMSTPIAAQSAVERESVNESANADSLLRLSVEFQKNFERQETRVLLYLRRHPDKPRSFQKNGSTYYLKRIDDDGNPVYITTKNAGSATNQWSDQPIRRDPQYGGGSR